MSKKKSNVKSSVSKVSKEQLTLLKEIIGRFAGETSIPIVDIIAGDKPVNEFKIAEKLNLTINQTRNILYKLSAQSIVSSVRKKDEKKGWYIYSWTIDVAKALGHFVDIKKKEIKNYEHLLHSRQTKGFYVCPNGDIETSEENALLHDFKCQECGQLLQPQNYEKEIAELQAKIQNSNNEISKINVELSILNGAKEKKEIRKEKKEKTRKKEERAKKAKKLKRERAKEKNGKGPKSKPKDKNKDKAKNKIKHKIKNKPKLRIKKGKKGKKR